MMRSRSMRTVRILLFVLLAGCAWAEDDVVQRAMRDELARSMQKLQLEGLSKPYFIAYRVEDVSTASTSANFGDLTASNENRMRWLAVEVRVGGYDFDSSNFLSYNFGRTGVARTAFGSQLPLENNYQEIRRQIWLATDAAYKKAVEDLSGKRAALQNRTRSEKVADFSQEEPGTFEDEQPAIPLNRVGMERLVRNISALFRAMPDINTTRVNYVIRNVDECYVNSEGTWVHRTKPSLAFTALATTQAPDGMPLHDFVAVYGASSRDLPPESELAAQVKDMGARLAKLREAPLLERYNGPVLFEDEAAAALFGQAFIPKLVGLREPISDNPQFERRFDQQSFIDRLGGRVLPDFMNITDDPTLAVFSGKPLPVHYKVDDDGVRARATKVVEHGTLNTLLTSRAPVEGVPHSTGNRRGTGPVPTNVIITADNGVSADELRRQFLALLARRNKEYGIVVRRIGYSVLRADPSLSAILTSGPGPDSERVGGVIAAFKVFPDGHEELVRNLQLTDVTPSTFKDIIAAGKEVSVFSEPFAVTRTGAFAFGFNPAEFWPAIASIAVPALLFDDVTLRKPPGEIPKPPIAGHPFFDKQGETKGK